MFCWLQEAHLQASAKNSFCRYISIYTVRCMVNIHEEHECAHSGTNCGRSHTSAQHSTASLMFTTLYLRMNRMNGSTLAHKHHTPPPTTKTRMCSPNWEIEYREKQFETRCVRSRVDVYSLQYASTATVLSRNRLIFKLFQISEPKHHANKKIHSNRQCKIYIYGVGSGRIEFEFGR